MSDPMHASGSLVAPILPTLQAAACGLPDSTQLLQVVNSNPADSPPEEGGGHSMTARNPVAKVRLTPQIFPSEKHQDELLRFNVMPKDHVGYAVTWALMGVTMAIFASYIIRARPARAAKRLIDSQA